MLRILKIFIVCLIFLISVFSLSLIVRAQGGIVHAVLFYSPTCGHCYYVITEVLPPLIDKYGGQLQLLGIDVTQPDGSALYYSALKKFNLDSSGVPFLVIGDTYLTGSVEIPEKFPLLIEQIQANGGVDWPEIPGLADALFVMGSKSSPTPAPTVIPSPKSLPIVHALLIYRSECGHCKLLMDEFIPPLIEQFGSQLQIFGVDATLPAGDALYDAAIARFNIQKFGVPTLIIGDHVMVGGEIRQYTADIIEEYLSLGGMDWPDIPGLAQMLTEAQTTATPSPYQHQQTPAAFSGTEMATPTPGILLAGNYPTDSAPSFASDPVGNSLAVLVLIGMIFCLGWAVFSFRRPLWKGSLRLPGWLIPVLCLFGLGVAAYLAYVELTQVEAVCGPVGDCNTVQQSAYARLFGILPIGVLGVIGNIMIVISWLVQKQSGGRLASYAALGMLFMTTFGLLFSIYLTFLEPFVIGATCAWCLTSSIIITALFLISIDPGKQAFLHLCRNLHQQVHISRRK